MVCHAKGWVGAGFALLFSLACPATSEARDEAANARDFSPAIRMHGDRRVRIPATRESSSRTARVAAAGIVRCGEAVGTAQLTLRADLITTAAHVLIAANGTPRSGCRFTPMGRAAVPIKMDSIKAGSTHPLSDSAMRDWAVARLSRPVSGVKPFGVAPPGAMPDRVVMCAAGLEAPADMGTETCRAHHVIKTSADGIREIAIDCSAAPGSSGAAILQGDKIYGIYVGYRSSSPRTPQPFSATHYNFAITVDGAFRRALLAAAR